MIEYLTSSKTLIMVMLTILVGVLVIIVSLAVLVAFGVTNPYINDLVTLLLGGNAVGGARNVISDGIMPRVPQAVAARTNPEVALQPPVTLAHSEGPRVNNGGPFIPMP